MSGARGVRNRTHMEQGTSDSTPASDAAAIAPSSCKYRFPINRRTYLPATTAAAFLASFSSSITVSQASYEEALVGGFFAGDAEDSCRKSFAFLADSMTACAASTWSVEPAAAAWLTATQAAVAREREVSRSFAIADCFCAHATGDGMQGSLQMPHSSE